MQLTGGDEHYTANGPLRRALLGPLGRMKVLEIDEATMHSEYPDSPRIDTPPQEMSDEEEEEQLQHSSHFNAHSMLGITSGKLGAAMKSISMGDDSTDISEEALMPRVVRLRPLPEVGCGTAPMGSSEQQRCCSGGVDVCGRGEVGADAHSGSGTSPSWR
jgi:hypothetical protein